MMKDSWQWIQHQVKWSASPGLIVKHTDQGLRILTGPQTYSLVTGDYLSLTSLLQVISQCQMNPEPYGSFIMERSITL